MRNMFIAIGASIIAIFIALVTGNSESDIQLGLKILLLQLVLLSIAFLIDEARNAAR